MPSSVRFFSKQNFGIYPNFRTVALYFKLFVDLCEVSPNSVLNKLEEEQINPTGLMALFENQSSDFLFGRNDYIEILWGVEEFLVQREYASRAYSWLLYLDNLSFEYKSNSPKDIFGKLLCPWHNFSAFSKSNDKIEIAAKALAKDKMHGTIFLEHYQQNMQVFLATYMHLNIEIMWKKT